MHAWLLSSFASLARVHNIHKIPTFQLNKMPTPPPQYSRFCNCSQVLNVYAPEKPVSDAPPKKQRAMIKTTLARNDPAEHFTVAEEVKEADTSDKQQAESGAGEENAVQAARSGWQPTQEWVSHAPLFSSLNVVALGPLKTTGACTPFNTRGTYSPSPRLNESQSHGGSQPL